jgi:1,2-phenylacetyl-CoA epoxidase PaaB subunit
MSNQHISNLELKDERTTSDLNIEISFLTAMKSMWMIPENKIKASPSAQAGQWVTVNKSYCKSYIIDVLPPCQHH